MLAWHCQMKTPQYPEGREIVLIANDVTVQSGSFGVQEDEFFYKVLLMSLYVIYFICNVLNLI